GYDHISAGDGNDYVDGGPGGAFITGGAGTDTIYFSRGYGLQTLVDNDAPPSSPDIVLLGADVLPSDVTASRSGTGLTLRVAGTSDSFAINKYFLNDTA